MEKYVCNICNKSIELESMENHIKESDHITRRNILEEKIKENGNFPRSSRSSLDYWRNNGAGNDL